MTHAGAPPWIGMPVQMDPGDDRQYLCRSYSKAIEASGGFPVLIPLLDSVDSAIPIAEKLDGILLTGSNSDLDPGLYGALRLDVCGPAQPLRDRMDYALLETGMRRRIPVLAICYGIQSLNAFLGGSLIQDIPAAISTPIRHSNPESKGSPTHRIRIAAGTVLEQAAAGVEAMVNSTHHQAVDRPGRGLEVIARAPDGVIESVMGTNPDHWILGVQWHPEKSFGCDNFSKNIFMYFLARCRAARGIE